MLNLKIKENDNPLFIKERCGEIVITNLNIKYYGYFYLKLGNYEESIIIEIYKESYNKEYLIEYIKNKILDFEVSLLHKVNNAYTLKSLIHSMKTYYNSAKLVSEFYDIEDTKKFINLNLLNILDCYAVFKKINKNNPFIKLLGYINYKMMCYKINRLKSII